MENCRISRHWSCLLLQSQIASESEVCHWGKKRFNQIINKSINICILIIFPSCDWLIFHAPGVKFIKFTAKILIIWFPKNWCVPLWTSFFIKLLHVLHTSYGRSGVQQRIISSTLSYQTLSKLFNHNNLWNLFGVNIILVPTGPSA